MHFVVCGLGGPMGENRKLAAIDGADKNLATSQHDVNAQQKGDKTAAGQADTKHEKCPN